MMVAFYWAFFYSLMFQEGMSSNMISLVCFHDLAMEMLVMIVFIVSSVLWYTFSFRLFAVRLDMHFIEFIWTLVPTFALVLIGLPSIWSLYFMEEEFSEGMLTEVGVVGKQWSWDFYFGDFNYLEELVSGTVSSYYLEGGAEDFRTLEVDSVLTIPHGVTCFNITSSDVIHSFACPALGVKIDAVPGKCNSFYCSILQPGFFLGSCAEMCGVNHSFMPFCILVYNSEVLDFYDIFYSDLSSVVSESSLLFEEDSETSGFGSDLSLLYLDLSSAEINALSGLTSMWAKMLHGNICWMRLVGPMHDMMELDPSIIYMFMKGVSDELAEKVEKGGSSFNNLLDFSLFLGPQKGD